MRTHDRIIAALFLLTAVPAALTAQNWLGRFDAQGASLDEGRVLLAGPRGTSIIVGSSVAKGAGWNATTGWDIAIAACDTAGTKRWSVVYDGPAHNDDLALCAVSDAVGNVFVGARSWDAATGWDALVLAYDTVGVLRWTRRIDGGSGGEDAARALSLDAQGNVLLAASSESGAGVINQLIVKFSATGAQLWRVRQDSGAAMRPVAIAPLGNGSVVVGSTRGTPLTEIVFVRYSSAGAQEWVRAVPNSAAAELTAMTADRNSSLLFTGTLHGSVNDDAIVGSLSPAGVVAWQNTWNGAANRHDRGVALTVDSTGSVFAAVKSAGAGGLFGAVAIKYQSDGTQAWATRYDSARTGADLQAPFFAGIATARLLSSRAARLSWSPARDDQSEEAAIAYDIFIAATSGGQNFSSPDQTVTGGTRSFTGEFREGADVYIVVRARDEAGNSDANTREVKISVPGPVVNALVVASDTTLGPGTHCFDHVIVQVGATLRFSGDAVLCARDSIAVRGTVLSNCHALALRSNGALLVTGRIDNRCTPAGLAPDLLLFAAGDFRLDSVSANSGVFSDGVVRVTDDSTLADWMFAIPFYGRSTTPLPPVGMVRVDESYTAMNAAAPAELSFLAEGADPDGGAVTFDIDFGDGTTRSAIPAEDGIGARIEKSYGAPGAYTVTLTIRDNENSTATAEVRVLVTDSTGIEPAAVGLGVSADGYAAGINDSVAFRADVGLLPEASTATVAWAFGDGGISAFEAPVHAFTAPGRYEVTATVTDDSNRTATSSMWVYVFKPDTSTFAPPRGSTIAVVPLAPPPAIIGAIIVGRKGDRVLFNSKDIIITPIGGIIGANGSNGAQAIRGASGTSFRLWTNGKVTINGGLFGAGNGGNGGPPSKDGHGKAGGNGGDMDITGKDIDVAGGFFFGSDGGDGSSDTKVGGPGQSVTAIGGPGGKPGKIGFHASKSITFSGPTNIILGNGGKGGDATATGGAGKNQCTKGQDGGSGTATGGPGGEAKKAGVATGNVTGTGNIQVSGSIGGDGGTATAVGGKGGDAINCKTTATGGKGGNATATGGKGGDAGYSGVGAAGAAAGTGTGGKGGDATATPGKGGEADAVGDPKQGAAGCPGQKGGDATATGGDGGKATANEGKGGKSNRTAGTDGNSTEVGSNGGHATGTAGDGGPGTGCGCAGGPGGIGKATGGVHGKNSGKAKASSDGLDGDAHAWGGLGGDGGDCCSPPGIAGPGGSGGDATANAHATGSSSGSGGSGGDGGDGCPHAGGGAFGVGTGTPTDIPDGSPGIPGAECCPLPKPVKLTTSCTGSSIPPGQTFTWNILDPVSSALLATVNMHYMTQQEAGGPVGYICLASNNDIGIQSGGMVFDMTSTVDVNNPSTPWRCTSFTFQGQAQNPGECLITGFKGGNPIATESVAVSGMSTVTLNAPAGQSFDVVTIQFTSPMLFDFGWCSGMFIGP
ncbi:MAG: PKD domain-containing protein [Ignavibacteria bacterium]|nr:PKD domain-containing protein [Ignavibacteria bacterium]